MSDSTPEAAALIRAGRTAFRPDAMDRDRVLASLRASLGEAAVLEPRPGRGASDAAGAHTSLLGVKVFGGIAALAIATGAFVGPRLWTKSSARLDASPGASTLRNVEPDPSTAITPSDDAPRAQTPPMDHSASASHTTARSTPMRPASLTEEVRLLSKAERQLSDGLGEDALRTLGEHERRFPKGALAEERMAARVEALCSVSRLGDARTELARLSRAYPKSPHLDGARRFCGDALSSAP